VIFFSGWLVGVGSTVIVWAVCSFFVARRYRRDLLPAATPRELDLERRANRLDIRTVDREDRR
jgi:hypothetical protein